MIPITPSRPFNYRETTNTKQIQTMKRKTVLLVLACCITAVLSAQLNHSEPKVKGNDIRNSFSCGTSTISDIDGNVYNTVLVGNQCWMRENLKVTKNPDGIAITRRCYENNPVNCDLYGGLYNWTTMMNGAGSSSTVPSGVQGICPDGWHIPSDAEYTALTDYITGGAATGGNRLKSCRQVGSPQGGECNTSDHPRWDYHNIQYGTDDYGFSLLPAGYRYGADIYDKLGQITYQWSATESSEINAWYRDIYYLSANVYRSSGSKSYAFSVRCLRNIPIEQTLNLENINVSAGQHTCYNALQTITVTNLEVQNGGIFLLIAGQQINLLPLCHIKSGANFHAFISTDGTYCSQQPGLLSLPEETGTADDYSQPVLADSFLSIYPNPTTGDFTLELLGFEEASIVLIEIFTMQGHLITRRELLGQKHYNLSLTGRQPGIYLIRVLKDNEIGTSKIIKQ
jgi:uncharacterized protein (TIGR02145 family)